MFISSKEFDKLYDRLHEKQEECIQLRAELRSNEWSECQSEEYDIAQRQIKLLAIKVYALRIERDEWREKVVMMDKVDKFKIICGVCGKASKLIDIVRVCEWTVDIKCSCGQELKAWYDSDEDKDNG